MLYVEEENKREELRTLLNSQPPSRTLIFVETKRSADRQVLLLYPLQKKLTRSIVWINTCMSAVSHPLPSMVTVLKWKEKML